MITIEKPKKVRDWTKVTEALLDGMVSLSTGKIISIYATAKKLRGDETMVPQGVEEMAWGWVQAICAEAAPGMLRDPRVRDHVEQTKTRTAAESFLERAMAFDDGEQLVAEHLIYPHRCAAFNKARDAAYAFLTEAAPDHRLSPAQAAGLFDRSVARHAGRVQHADPELFSTLQHRFADAALEPDRRRLAWARHSDWIRGLWEREPIFAQEDDSGITLARTYLKLRCFWHTEVPPEKAGDKVEEHVAHIGMLHETVRAALDDPRGPQLQLVAGSPGCGKSSFARALAVELLDDAVDGTPRNVLLVRLQNFRFKQDLSDALAEHLSRRHRPLKAEGAEGMKDNPLEFLKEGDDPLVILFDGLDELSHDETTAKAQTDSFVKSVQMLFRDWQPDELRVVVLGRSAACQDAAAAAELDVDRVLHVLPMRELASKESNAMALLAGSRRLDAVEDPHTLRDAEQREAFYLQNAVCLGLPADAAPEAVTARSMEALNAEPLLLYLLMHSGYTGANWKQVRNNPNLVYAEIFRRVHERNETKRPAGTPKLSEHDFFTLMECLGLAAWQGNGRTGDEAEFIRIREVHADDDQAERFESDPLADLKNVAVQTYTRSDLGDDAGFEFVHKSFGEYLTARALISAAERMGAKAGISRPGKFAENARRWQQIIGEGELTPEIMLFLRREEISDPEVLLPRLEGFLHIAIEDGFPVHASRPEASWRELAVRERSALTALTALCSVTASRCFQAEGEADQAEGEADTARSEAEPRVFSLWPRKDEVREINMLNGGAFRTLERLHATALGSGRLTLQRVNLSGAILIGVNLRGADLKGAKLEGAILIRANLQFSDLIMANLSQAHLISAHLTGANLIRANLSGANMSEAELNRAELVDANLSGANLPSADLSEAFFSGANLRRADLSGADLSEAFLTEADLHEADLSNTNLTGAYLVNAQLGEVDLSRAILREADLRGADLSGVDLTGADLRRATLIETDLSGADLSGANLSEVNLTGANLRHASLKSARCDWRYIDSAQLHFADLTGASELDAEMLFNARGNAGTTLPQGVPHPAGWLADDD